MRVNHDDKFFEEDKYNGGIQFEIISEGGGVN